MCQRKTHPELEPVTGRERGGRGQQGGGQVVTSLYQEAIALGDVEVKARCVTVIISLVLRVEPRHG